MSSENRPVWMVTGANKGIGAAIAGEALARGFRVVAAARNPESVGRALGDSPDLLPVGLDITDDGQAESAVQAALARFGTIDVLVNNAGYGLLGHFEEMSEGQVRRQIETNLFGTMKITRAVLPVMRKQRSGRVIVVTSTSGIRAVPGGSVYSASKFALEGWAEGMRFDCEPFGIEWMLLEPGSFRTDFLNERASTEFPDMSIDDYKGLREAIRASFSANDRKQAGDPARLAKILMTALESGEPPFRLLAGKGAIAGIAGYYAERFAEFEKWKGVAAESDFA